MKTILITILVLVSFAGISQRTIEIYIEDKQITGIEAWLDIRNKMEIRIAVAESYAKYQKITYKESYKIHGVPWNAH